MCGSDDDPEMPDDPQPFEKTSIPLPALHGWKCKAGNNLFVAERGAVAFEIPAGWVIRHDQKQTVSIHDREPPADEVRISLTIFRLPPVKGGWGKLPLKQLLAMLWDEERRQKNQAQEELIMNEEKRPDVELVWSQKPALNDPENGKPILCRQLLARARLVQCLITFEVYEDVAERFQSAWTDLLETLKVAIPRDLTGHVGN
jgi:hypothetical protein